MKKTFDCVEMKRRKAARLTTLLDGMSREEQFAFWQERTQGLRKLQQEAKMATHTGTSQSDKHAIMLNLGE
jgi:hypothetical protein